MGLILRFGIVGALVMAVCPPVWAQGAETTADAVRATGFTELRSTATAAIKTAATTATASIMASNMPLEIIARQLSEQSGMLIEAKEGTKDIKVSVVAPKPRPVSEILEMLVKPHPALVLKTVPGGYEISLKNR